jgi:hypothetical protein
MGSLGIALVEVEVEVEVEPKPKPRVPGMFAAHRRPSGDGRFFERARILNPDFDHAGAFAPG